MISEKLHSLSEAGRTNGQLKNYMPPYYRMRGIDKILHQIKLSISLAEIFPVWCF